MGLSREELAGSWVDMDTFRWYDHRIKEWRRLAGVREDGPVLNINDCDLVKRREITKNQIPTQ